jgi:hypothetical protein
MILFRKKELMKMHTARMGTSVTAPLTTKDSAMSKAHQNLQSGFARLSTLSDMITSSASHPSSVPTSASTVPVPLSSAEIEEQARNDVEAELHLYLSHPNVKGHISACEILSFWQVSQ